MTKAFVSYSRHDLTVVASLVEALETYPGIDLWFPERDVRPSPNVWPDIADALDSSESFLLCASPNTWDEKTPVLAMEKQRALERHAKYPFFRLVTAVIAEGGVVPQLFETSGTVDMTKATWSEGVKALASLLVE